MVNSESSGDARDRLSCGNTEQSLTESEVVRRSVLAGQSGGPALAEVAARSAEESHRVPRRIPRESHGQDQPLVNFLNWRVLAAGLAFWVVAAAVVVAVVVWS